MSAVPKLINTPITTPKNTRRKRRRRSRNIVNNNVKDVIDIKTNAKSGPSGPKIASKASRACTTNLNKRRKNKKLATSSSKSASKSLSLNLDQNKTLSTLLRKKFKDAINQYHRPKSSSLNLDRLLHLLCGEKNKKIAKQLKKEERYLIKFNKRPRSSRKNPQLYGPKDIKLFPNNITINGTEIPIGTEVVFWEGKQELIGKVSHIDWIQGSIKLHISLNKVDQNKYIERTIYLYQLNQQNTYFWPKSGLRQ